MQFRFDSTVPKNMNKPKSDSTTNKRGLFYSKRTLPSLPDFCNSFSKWKNQLNFVDTSFRNVCKLRKTLFYGKIISRQILETRKNLILSR